MDKLSWSFGQSSDSIITQIGWDVDRPLKHLNGASHNIRSVVTNVNDPISGSYEPTLVLLRRQPIGAALQCCPGQLGSGMLPRGHRGSAWCVFCIQGHRGWNSSVLNSLAILAHKSGRRVSCLPVWEEMTGDWSEFVCSVAVVQLPWWLCVFSGVKLVVSPGWGEYSHGDSYHQRMEDLPPNHHGCCVAMALLWRPCPRRMGPAAVRLPRLSGGAPGAPGGGREPILRRLERHRAAPLPAVGKFRASFSCSVHQPDGSLYWPWSAASSAQAQQRYCCRCPTRCSPHVHKATSLISHFWFVSSYFLSMSQ